MSIALLESLDPYAHLRGKLRELSSERNDYSGYPIPLDGQRLVIEPTFKYRLDEIGKEPEEEAQDFKLRNIFWSWTKRSRIAVCEDPDGKIWHCALSGSANQAKALLNTLGASDVWGLEQEAKAQNLLATLLPHRQFKQYLLTGSFLERSPHSEITYMFRRLRPTLAISGRTGAAKILCALCMHPIGYYEESWAGCMTPTDDVLAHLLMSRGDERMFWKRCYQHPAWDPASGI